MGYHFFFNGQQHKWSLSGQSFLADPAVSGSSCPEEGCTGTCVCLLGNTVKSGVAFRLLTLMAPVLLPNSNLLCSSNAYRWK